MSVQAMAWVLTESKSTLGTRLVALAIANYAKHDGTGAWPSIATIARDARLSPRQVQYSIRKLEHELEELSVTIGGGPRKGTNLYALKKMGDEKSASPSVQPTEPGCAVQAKKGCNPRQGGMKCVAPDPSLEPSVKPSIEENQILKAEAEETATAAIRRIECAFSCFKMAPFGTKEFQEIWCRSLDRFRNNATTNLSEIMETAIQECRKTKGKVPSIFFALKRKIEQYEVDKAFPEKTKTDIRLEQTRQAIASSLENRRRQEMTIR